MKGYNRIEEMENELCDEADRSRQVKHYSHEVLYYLDGNKLNAKREIAILRRAIRLVALRSVR